MVCAVSVIIVLATCFLPWVSCLSLQECQTSCVQKIPNKQLCNETCLQLQNVSSTATNATGMLAVPGPPRLLAATYFTFTLEWNEYTASAPVRYVLEVTRHKNITSPNIILPFIEKYHVVKNSTFTIPEKFVTKTNFSFRMAVVAFHGTSNFSLSSPLYTTNMSCERGTHAFNNSRVYPCPVFNLRLHYHVTPVQYQRPRISSTLFWDYPDDIENLEDGHLHIEVLLSTRLHVAQRCYQEALLQRGHYDYLNINDENRSSLLFPSNSILYFGCPYVAKVHSEVEYERGDGNKFFEALATFNIPLCFQGFCGCEKPHSVFLESKFLHIEIRSGNSTNRTAANVTWDVQAWNAEAAYFRIFVFCIGCSWSDQRVVNSSETKTTYSQYYHDLNTGRKHRVNIFAFDKSGCEQRPLTALFDAVLPTTLPTTLPPTSMSSMSSSMSSMLIPVTSTAATNPVIPSVEPAMSSATVAAITVPLVLLVLMGLVVLFFFRRRLKKKPSYLHRGPIDLQGLASRLDNHPSSAYASDWDRSGLMVNLPAKSEGGLEVNPAYVEQRIHDAIESGEVDEFELGYHRLELKQVLGKGAFGKVFLAEAFGIGDTGGTSLVAVKVLNERAREDEVEDFKIEIEFMKTLGHHENVLTMLGCCTLYPPLCLVMEYVPHGDLLHYLRNLRKTFEKQLKLKPQSDDDEIKAKFTTPNTLSQWSGSPGSYSHRPLVPSISDTAICLKYGADEKPRSRKPPLFPLKFQRRPLRQCLSECKQHSINNNWLKKSGLDFERCGTEKVKRSHSTASLKTLKTAAAMLAKRRASANPSVHYVDRDPTEMSNTTQMTLVPDSISAIKDQSRSATVDRNLDGALDSADLQSFAYQIANGMAYLTERGVVHRDLAARNILVGEEKVLKISDFGLSREGVYVKRSTGKIPLRWLSIEAMRDRIYSTASDIWAFGIVLWEICTLGGFPYPTLNDRDLLTFLTDGKRMNKPENCTDEIYQLMLACWSRECEDRPSFQNLKAQLFNMQKQEQPYVNVDPSQDFSLPPTAGQDTAGNLISFSDGALSNSAITTDQCERKSDLQIQSDAESSRLSASNELSTSRDVQNAGYESSDSDSLTSTNPQTSEENGVRWGPSPKQVSLGLANKMADSLV